MVNTKTGLKFKNFIQIYKIKVNDLRNIQSQKNSERNIYLNIKFED